MSASPAYTTTPTHPATVRILYSASGGSIAIPAWQVEDWRNEYRSMKARYDWLRQTLESIVPLD